MKDNVTDKDTSVDLTAPSLLAIETSTYRFYVIPLWEALISPALAVRQAIQVGLQTSWAGEAAG